MAVEIVTVLGAIASSIGLVDKISDELENFLSKRKKGGLKYKALEFKEELEDEPRPKVHSLRIEQEGSKIVARSHGEVVQTITTEDLEKLPEQQLRHIMVLEKSMENNYSLWAKLYPERNASPDPLVNARVDQQLSSLVSRIKDDLNGILQFLQMLGIQLDDHYMHIRHIVNQA